MQLARADGDEWSDVESATESESEREGVRWSESVSE